MRKHRHNQSQAAEINMTPMLDIVFIMLIFFIVTSTFIRESGLTLNEHQSKENPDEQKSARAVIVSICANGNIRVDGRTIDVRAVRANIERRQAEDSSAVVIIETEQAAPTGLLVTALDQARAAEAAISVSPQTAFCPR